MLRIATALSALGLLLSPIAASAEDDCAVDSTGKASGRSDKLRFELNINNKTARTLTADFYKTFDNKTAKFQSRAMSPGQKVSVTENFAGRGTAKIETRLASLDGGLTFDPTYFSVMRFKDEDGHFQTQFLTGPFDAKITCDRRWNSNEKRFIVNYVINEK